MNANATTAMPILPDFMTVLSSLFARLHGFFRPRQSATVDMADDYDAAMKAREAEMDALYLQAAITPYNYRLHARRAALVDACEDYETATLLNTPLPLARRLVVMDAMYLSERFRHRASAWVARRNAEAADSYCAQARTAA